MSASHHASSRSSAPSGPSAAPQWLEIVQSHVKGLRFGVVQIVVHDSQVVQIERTEKTRLDRPSGRGGDAGSAHD